MSEVDVWRGRPDPGLLRGVLARYLERPLEEIELAIGEHGKPRLADRAERLEFNLSHSGGVALVAVCRGRAVGVDVERIDPSRDLLGLAERALDLEAVAAVRAAPPARRAAVFYDRWTRHEARLKCLGVGLGGPADGEPVAVAPLDIGPGYAAAVAVLGDELPAVCLIPA